jgi:NAD(P)-dependent dehydrogenase (short-subunit alcohol dehydrogenase family)
MQAASALVRGFARLQGRVAAVVGAASGFGYASALRLSRDGADLLLIDSNDESLADLLEEVRRRGGQATAQYAGLDDYEQLREAVSRSGLSKLDVLVNNHARLSWGTVETLDIDDFADIVRFNLVGPIASTRAFLEPLKRAQNASVIHLGSVDGLFGNPVAVAYSVSKAGLGPMTRIMAREFAPHGVRVNAVASAQTSQVTATEVEDGNYRHPVISLPNFPGGRYMENLSRATPLKRWGPREQWAGTVSFLASDDAAHVTGSVIVVDCGRTGLTPGTFPWDSPSTT